MLITIPVSYTHLKLGYHTHQSHAGVYIFLIEGEIIVDGEVMKRRDGMGIYEMCIRDRYKDPPF